MTEIIVETGRPLATLCREYYERRKEGYDPSIACMRYARGRCHFSHPDQLTAQHDQEYARERGWCYCGSRIRIVRNYRTVVDEDERIPFIAVCSKTGKSIRRCAN